MHVIVCTDDGEVVEAIGQGRAGEQDRQTLCESGLELLAAVGALAADLVVLEWRPPFPMPEASEGSSALLWAGSPAAWAVVDGVVRLREGRLLGGDEAEIAARAREEAARVLRG